MQLTIWGEKIGFVNRPDPLSILSIELSFTIDLYLVQQTSPCTQRTIVQAFYEEFWVNLGQIATQAFSTVSYTEKCILKVLRNPMGGSMEIEPNVTKLLPYMAIIHNNEGVWSHNHTL